MTVIPTLFSTIIINFAELQRLSLEYDMKKFVLLALIASLMPIVATAQNSTIHTVMVEPVKSDKMELSDDSCVISFRYSENSGTLYFSLYNKTENRVYIEWENARFDYSRIVFGDDTRLSMRSPKADEAVPSKSMSMMKDIISEAWVGDSFINNPLKPEKVRGRGGNECHIVIPVRFADGNTIDYKFVLGIYHYNPVDCSQIKEGMKASQVKKIAGKPDDMDVDPWGTANTKAVWYYAGNKAITIDKGVVTAIRNLHRDYMVE